MYRFHPRTRKLAELVAAGDIGAPTFVHGQYLQDWLLEDTDPAVRAALRMQESVKRYSEGVRRSHGIEKPGDPHPGSTPVDVDLEAKTVTVTGEPLDEPAHLGHVVLAADSGPAKRYRAFLAEALDCSVRDIQAMVLGGHGDQMVSVISATTVGGSIYQVLITGILVIVAVTVDQLSRKGGR